MPSPIEINLKAFARYILAFENLTFVASIEYYRNLNYRNADYDKKN